VVGRFIVTECYSKLPVANATVTVKNSDDETVATGTTDGNGTVAVNIDGRPGFKYKATISEGATTTDWDFTAQCGVNEIEVDFGASQQICIQVVDNGTGTTVEDIPVIIYRSVGNPPRREEVARGTGGTYCLERGGGGIFEVSVNQGTGMNPDYAGTIREITAPSCEDSTHKIGITLITNAPGAHLVTVYGCQCGLSGATVTIKILAYKPTAPGWCYTLDGSDPIVTEATMSTDDSGRAWFTPEIAGIPFFGSQYNPDANQYECYEVIDFKVEGPSPYESRPYKGNTYYDIYSNTTYAHLQTPPTHHCNGDDYCLDIMPESITAVISGSPSSPGPPPVTGFDGSYTLERRYFSPGNPSDVYELCIPTGTYSAYLFLYGKARLGWCEPFDYRYGWFSIYRMFIPCDWEGIADFQVSEKIVDLIGRASLGGTGGCPLDWHGQQFNRFWNGSYWIENWGAIMVDVTE
jgi:hypothetical protein